jgi:hypothetical protein
MNSGSYINKIPTTQYIAGGEQLFPNKTILVGIYKTTAMHPI